MIGDTDIRFALQIGQPFFCCPTGQNLWQQAEDAHQAWIEDETPNRYADMRHRQRLLEAHTC